MHSRKGQTRDRAGMDRSGGGDGGGGGVAALGGGATGRRGNVRARGVMMRLVARACACGSLRACAMFRACGCDIARSRTRALRHARAANAQVRLPPEVNRVLYVRCV